jgi:beta-N-acetylhexosaminidase
MVTVLGSRDEQASAVQAIAEALADGSLERARLRRSCARLDTLAKRYPVRQARYANARREKDEQLMFRAWALALTPIGDPRPPRRDQPLRVITQRQLPSDGVSEAGPSDDAVASLFEGFGKVEIVQLDTLQNLDWGRLPQDGRATVLVSSQRTRFGAASLRWRPHLHLALWNPFQVLDVAAPAVISWGFAEGALAALRAWLEGRAPAPGRVPVPLALPAPAPRRRSVKAR